ncbi:MAG: hypothetical protein VKJ46_07165 [Leptolyngbyaceae bacterium]|nr:hypothetical protein [Leptolyngbyaceae bacterium]
MNTALASLNLSGLEGVGNGWRDVAECIAAHLKMMATVDFAVASGSDRKHQSSSKGTFQTPSQLIPISLELHTYEL